ncbi:short-chain dehydrogenase [Rhodococcus sp. 05-340-1]|uniref:SDR family NAD(P)-dependent oxidoreductase n=1 Tax=Nocardiaceae TaxID=85025 RepID=UPI00050C1A09|nr:MULTISPECIES: SDR family oxidoreductase [Rhodococcus]OZC87717.1 short-chain dehydrogenase [Rhodococcus sp. 06-412-2C]OZC96368.1 short-chain dehydrogenase [Rhodococcus sp. 06-412-2B]OZD65352.1 short-chain dehydrogenase [Rhodococcus sp. 05-340-2]OZD74602.1 short-chain dehydrogenase [Rhodococcus sp. 05-340-1]OZD86625.1 short-chain dehydrogenase [Rhodococcus sp. 05-339-2]
MFDLQGHIALVTGAGQSVGAGIATVLARQGASVIVNDLHPDRAERVAAAIAAEGHTAVASAWDVTDYQSTVDHVRSAEAELGGHVDILVNNAGVAEGKWNLPFRELTPELWRLPIDLNIYGSLNCTKAVIDGMCDNGWGRVVQISSGSARTGQNINVSMYATGKSGIEGFVRHLAAECGQYGVTANVLALGQQSNLADVMPADMIERIVATIPIGRLGDAEEVGAACVYLASHESGGLTGQTIDFNGGTHTR